MMQPRTRVRAQVPLCFVNVQAHAPPPNPPAALPVCLYAHTLPIATSALSPTIWGECTLRNVKLPTRLASFWMPARSRIKNVTESLAARCGWGGRQVPILHKGDVGVEFPLERRNMGTSER